jgi:hypothetical protein
VSLGVSLKKIHKKQQELNLEASKKDNNLADSLVYKRSCELDKLIVSYMKTNQQMEIIF